MWIIHSICRKEANLEKNLSAFLRGARCPMRSLIFAKYFVLSESMTFFQTLYNTAGLSIVLLTHFSPLSI